jgi:hypothetical protein
MRRPINALAAFSVSDKPTSCIPPKNPDIAGKSAPLGIYVGTVSHKGLASLESSCPRTVQIKLDMLLVDRRVEIGQELQQQPCRFSVALQHYTKIARADEASFAQYVSVTAGRIAYYTASDPQHFGGPVT